MILELQHFIEALLMPPGHSVVLWLLALIFLLRGRPTGATLMTLLGIVSVVVFSLPVTAGALLRGLQPEAVTVEQVQAWQPGAIVVLAGGRRLHAPEFGPEAETVSDYSLHRARYAAVLQRQTELPVLVTGGIVGEGTLAEATLIANFMREELGVDPRWVEQRSRNTAENARLSAEMLALSGISRIALVTSAIHMPRAVAVFEQAGLAVLAAPTGFVTSEEADLRFGDFVPRASALAGSVSALHEMLGMLWYRLRGFA